MDSRRLILFIALSLGLMLLWDKYMLPKSVQTNIAKTGTTTSSSEILTTNKSNNVTESALTQILPPQIININTDLMHVKLNTQGGDIRDIDLLKMGSIDDSKKPFQLMYQQDGRTYIAQTGLVSDSGLNLPTHKSMFSVDKLNYTMTPSQDTISVKLQAVNDNQINVIKTYTFKRDSYVIDVSYQITNNTNQPLSQLRAYWRILRDEQPPLGETKFVHTFTGPVYYTDLAKFNKIKFDDLAKNDFDTPVATNNGWVGFTEHYFTTLWLLNQYNSQAVCVNGITCRFNFKMTDNGLASSGLFTDLPVIKPGGSYYIRVPLFAGPQEYTLLAKTAPELERTKDYGWVYIFSTPLFWLLVHIYTFVKNWGLAIIVLTILVKTILYPLTRASYKSMARMKALSPKMEQLKIQYKDDKAKLQQAMMAMYRQEKVNPIGGCLPMLLQIPVFIGLYWALLSSVELRQASFLWIQDLSRPDPYFILPIILALTMFLQTFLNPPVADPVQAKMMKIMPLAFSVMFFFFPAGLVIYWLVNNLISMAQQWYVNNHVAK